MVQPVCVIFEVCLNELPGEIGPLVFMLFGEFVVFLSGPFRDFFAGVRRGEGLVGDDAGRARLDDGVMQASHVFFFPSCQIQLLRAVPDVGDVTLVVQALVGMTHVHGDFPES